MARAKKQRVECRECGKGFWTATATLFCSEACRWAMAERIAEAAPCKEWVV